MNTIILDLKTDLNDGKTYMESDTGSKKVATLPITSSGKSVNSIGSTSMLANQNRLESRMAEEMRTRLRERPQ